MVEFPIVVPLLGLLITISVLLTLATSVVEIVISPIPKTSSFAESYTLMNCFHD